MNLMKKCIICQTTDFEIILSSPQFPIMAISNDTADTIFYDFTLLVCNNCKCLQLKNLIDPSILYSDNYTNSSFSPSWKDHHIYFSKFILKNSTDVRFLEIGANKGDLFNCMSTERKLEYTTLDMYKHKDLPNEIKFIEGNCETYNFSGFKTLILSHVFEHLYLPHTFIKNIKDADVSSVYISIPNFDLLLNQKSICLLHSQHTFYCGDDYIKYLFSLYNYTCVTSYVYNGNFKSGMYKFVLDITLKQINLPTTDIKLYKEIYIEKINKIKNTSIPPNSYIIPSGIYGQYFYYFINQKNNIVGFLDNNSQRHNNKLYGTDKEVYSPLNIDYTKSTVIVCECPYTDEIVNGLKKISPSINLIYI